MWFSSDDFSNAMLVLVLIGVFIGAALVEGLPWLWELLKPWLHQVTG